MYLRREKTKRPTKYLTQLGTVTAQFDLLLWFIAKYSGVRTFN
jgi:hypothetical protein